MIKRLSKSLYETKFLKFISLIFKFKKIIAFGKICKVVKLIQALIKSLSLCSQREFEYQ